jgi:hypothetical protein
MCVWLEQYATGWVGLSSSFLLSPFLSPSPLPSPSPFLLLSSLFSLSPFSFRPPLSSSILSTFLIWDSHSVLAAVGLLVLCVLVIPGREREGAYRLQGQSFQDSPGELLSRCAVRSEFGTYHHRLRIRTHKSGWAQSRNLLALP